MANIFCEEGSAGFTVRELSAAEVAEEIAASEESAVGRYIIDKYRTGAAERGHAAVAAQLKKQGIPFEMALLILGIEPRSTEHGNQ